MATPRPPAPPLLSVLILTLFAAAPSFAEAPVPPDHAEKMARGVDLFTKSVRPLLLDRCVRCHGGEKTRSSLDLTTREGLLRGGDKGLVVVPGQSKESRLYRFIAHLDEPFMPPKEDGLSAAAVAQVAAWIDFGAPYDKPLLDKAVAKKPRVVTDDDRKYWAFLPLKRPPEPKVKDEAWRRTPIDSFVLAKLEEKGLTPNAPADRRKLIRRAYLDLLGLPPSPEAVEAFVADPAPDAYDRLIDQLLDNPHYGERWARHWLDLAHYADSHGYEQDYDRPNAYTYRDFVIKAFNRDLPFDTFVKWQIAGDEFAPDDPLALTATGFLGCGTHATQITQNQVEKERYDELDDIVRTTGTTMLGLTIGCARCHDHKYDPIPTRDYYRMMSTFTTTVRSDMDVDFNPEATKAARAAFDAENAKLVEARTKYETDQLPAKFDQWLSSLASRGRKPPEAPRWAILDVTPKSQGGADFTKLADGSVLAGGKNADFDVYTFTAATTLKGITAIRLEALADPSMVKGGPGRAANGNFDLTDFRVTAAPLSGQGTPVQVKLVNPKATFEQKGLPIAAAIDGDKKSGWAVDPEFGKDHAAVFETAAEVGFDGGTLLTFTMEFNGNNGHNIGRPRLSVCTAARPVGLDGGAAPADALAALAAFDADPTHKPTDAQRAALMRWYRTTDPQWRELNGRVEEQSRKAPAVTTVKAMICSEGVPAIRFHTQGGDFLEQTHFLKRGDPNQKDGVATQSFLQVLMPNAPDAEKRWQVAPPPGSRTSYRRRSLANWITDVDDGAGRLLARVIVNRLWQHHFGRGIVATPSDFGAQGEKPTNPELLDWLAQELIDSGWKLKHIHKLMMTSATYVESSAYDKGKATADVDDRFLWRFAPRRLEAEAVRDAILSVSGRAGCDHVRPRHAGSDDETPGDLLHDQAQPADPDDDAVRRPRFAGRHRGAADDDRGAAGAAADEQRPGARRRDAPGGACAAEDRHAAGRRGALRLRKGAGSAADRSGGGGRGAVHPGPGCGVPEGRQGRRRAAGADGLLPSAAGVERVYLCGLMGIAPIRESMASPTSCFRGPFSRGRPMKPGMGRESMAHSNG